MAVSSDVALAVGANWRLSRVEIPREIPVQATRVQELAAVRALSERFLGIDSQAELRKVDAAYGRNVFTAIAKMPFFDPCARGNLVFFSRIFYFCRRYRLAAHASPWLAT